MKKLLTAILTSSILLTPFTLQAKEIEGVQFKYNLKSGNKKLKFIGAGLREKWLFNVYTLGVYSESGSCDKDKIINAEESKSLLLVMLRDVDAKQMSSTIAEAFEQQLPENASKDLKVKKEKFEGFFKEKLTKGSRLQFDYTPGKGMTISQNDKSIGTIEGSDFSKVFFQIYFSSKTCCPELLKGIMECSSK